MSDPKKIPGAFNSGTGAVRDAIPTADEGDALLDMLFDDAPRDDGGASARSNAPTPIPPPLPPTKPPPPMDAPETPRRPVPERPSRRGEVVAPPGWATTPSPRVSAPTMPEPDMEDVATRAFAAPPPDYEDLDSAPGIAPFSPSQPEDELRAQDDDDDLNDRTVVAPGVMAVALSELGEEVAHAEDGAAEADPIAMDDVELFDPAEVAASPDLFVPRESSVEEIISEPDDDDLSHQLARESDAEIDVGPAPSAGPAHVGLGISVAPRRVPVDGLDDEEDASVALSATPGLRDSFLTRADWLREEALLNTDKGVRARLLLVVSELSAQAGEDAASAEAARDAFALAPNMPLVSRQHRLLTSKTGDLAQAADLMEAEIRHMPSPEARAHGAWFAAEVARVALGDDAQAKRRVDLAMRAAPSDPRASIQKFVEAAASLSEPLALSKMRPSDPETLAPLASAFSLVAALRGHVDAGPNKQAAAPRHVVEAVLNLRAALESGEPAAIATQAAHLRGGTFAASAGWLAASITAARAETRNEALAALADAAEGTAAALARRALASLAVELGESVDPRDPQAFSPMDRIALAALDAARNDPGGRAAREMLTSIIDDAGAASAGGDDAEDVGRLTGAVVAALTPGGEQRLSRLRYVQGGSPGSRAAALLARVLGEVDAPSPHHREAIDAAITELVQHGDPPRPAWTAIVRALGLELDIDAGAAERVAETIATWGSDGERSADAAGMLAAALLAEVSGDVERARVTYAEVHKEDPTCEAVARAADGCGDAEALARALKEHADLLSPGLPKAVLLTECAIRFSSLSGALGESAEASALSEEADLCAKSAAETAPGLPIAVHLGELGARARADQESLVEWLRFRRESSDDAVERAHDLTREALLISDGESNSASSLLEEALRARPTDFGLRDLFERLSPEATSDRASWREARAAEAKGPESARLSIEAALEYERVGDIESAARCAKLAELAGDDSLAPIAANRFAIAGFGAAELVDSLLPTARNTEDAALRLEIYERLAELDERGRGDTGSGLLFRRTILEENPSHMRTLRRVASVLMSGSRDDELEPVVMELARNLEGGEAAAYAALAARLRQRVRWEDTAEPVAIAYSQEPRPLWAIRQMAAHARQRGDIAVAAQCDRELMDLTGRPSERATLALRAAQAVRVSGDLETARQLLEEAVTLVPEHVVARIELASVLAFAGDAAAAAAELEIAAEGVGSPAWKQDLDLQAALLWQDKVGDTAKARAALERVAAVDPNNVEVFERLRQIYVQNGDRSELADLLSRRLEAIDDPGERVEMEVMRGRALAEVGDSEAAKRALAAALDANPDHVEALGSFAELCFTDADYDGAEQALIRLARLTSEPEKQIDIYFRLGHLYDELLPNEERAELAYQEILKRRPTDAPAREKLIALYRRMGQMPRAVEEQNVLVNAAETPEEKCQRTIELAEILEEIGELKKAESTLVVARKSFPKSDSALRALVRFYQRTGQSPAGAILLDRAVADARRALGTGRFETFLFETLATAAELRGRIDAANSARAAVLAIDGNEVDISGVGVRAGDASLDELLAPEVMTPAFRDLLIRTGGMLDGAFPYDLDGVRATPPPAPLAHINEEVRALAGAYGLAQISVLVSNVLGPICIPACAHPPTIVMGHTLASQPPSAERTFLLHRAMKVLQSNAAVFARTAPIDLWPLLAAYLRVFQPQFSPQGVDAARFSEAYGRLSRSLPPGLGPDIGVLATDVIGTIGNRASTLNSAINGWGSRAGLLAVGDPNVALNSIAWAGGNGNGPPDSGKDRLTWIGRNAEARDLIIFSVSDGYVDARARLGAS